MAHGYRIEHVELSAPIAAGIHHGFDCRSRSVDVIHDDSHGGRITCVVCDQCSRPQPCEGVVRPTGFGRRCKVDASVITPRGWRCAAHAIEECLVDGEREGFGQLFTGWPVEVEAGR